MRERRPAEGAHHRIGHGHGAGRQDHRLTGRRVHVVVEQAGELGAHVAHGPVHGLVGGVVIAHDGAEGDEADVPVQRLLRNSAGHDHVVVAAFLAVAGHHGQQAGEDPGAAHVGAHRQQADLADAGALRLGQVILQAAQLFVQGKGPAVADADHADQVLFPSADEVGVLVVEAVNEDAGVVGGVLGDLLDEGGIVQLEDFFKLQGSSARLNSSGRAWWLLPFVDRLPTDSDPDSAMLRCVISITCGRAGNLADRVTLY